jgi:hypothetical protein
MNFQILVYRIKTHFYDLKYETAQESLIHHREMNRNTKITENSLLMHNFKQGIFTVPDSLLTQSPHFVAQYN